MPNSMTGFARKTKLETWGDLSCEIRSVNHRYLEPSFRLPETLRVFESKLRERLKSNLNRGKVEVSIQLKTESASESQLELNIELAKTLSQMGNKLKAELNSNAELDPMDLLKWPGMIKSAEVDNDTLETALLDLFDQTLSQMLANREREGHELKLLIQQRLDEIKEKVKYVRARLPEILTLHQDKLKAKLETLNVELDQERFTQEAVYIAQKADVAEELDRLDAHLIEANHILSQNTPIGRRLDFLMQEFNREANTLSSKSLTSDTTQVAVDLKVLIEQMREQVQNIE